METVYLIKAVLDGFLIGWGTCYLVGCARAWLKTAAAAPRDALARDDGAAEPVAGTPAAGNPGANAVEGPFGQSRDGSGGNRPDYGDDDGFHGESVSQKQEGRK